MESLFRAFADWLGGLRQSTPQDPRSIRTRRDILLPCGERCPFVTVTTVPPSGQARPPHRIVDLWDLGLGPVGPEAARRMSLKVHLVDVWSWNRLESSEVQGRRNSGHLEVRGNLVGRTVGDEALFDVLGNSGRRLRLWTHEWDGARLQMNPYVPPGDPPELSSSLDDFLEESDAEPVLTGPESGLAGALPKA